MLWIPSNVMKLHCFTSVKHFLMDSFDCMLWIPSNVMKLHCFNSVKHFLMDSFDWDLCILSLGPTRFISMEAHPMISSPQLISAKHGTPLPLFTLLEPETSSPFAFCLIPKVYTNVSRFSNTSASSLSWPGAYIFPLSKHFIANKASSMP